MPNLVLQNDKINIEKKIGKEKKNIPLSLDKVLWREPTILADILIYVKGFGIEEVSFFEAWR